MKQKAIIIDIDGTLANCDHRKKLTENGAMDRSYFIDPEKIEKDTVNEWCHKIVRMFQRFTMFHVIFVTGRPESLRRVTKDFLKNHGLLS